jgi:hypothetical protein
MRQKGEGVIGILLLLAVICAVAGVLSGCAAQQAERDIANYAPYCEKLGYRPDTDPWRDCIQTRSANMIGASQGAARAVRQSAP